jgi:hypothetical protein
MNRHSRTVILLGGWLLMTPRPMNESGSERRFDTGAPITEWRQEWAYDSARECEAARAGKMQAATEKRDDRWQSFWLNARCVPTESVYPPLPPPSSEPTPRGRTYP